MANRDTILIVDDIEMNRAILSELFKDKYRVLEADNGYDAVAIAEKNNDKKKKNKKKREWQKLFGSFFRGGL